MSKRTMQEVQDEALQNLRLLIKDYSVDIIVDSPDQIQQRLGIDTPTWRSVRNKLVEFGRIELIANPKSNAYPAIRILKDENNEPVELKQSGWHKCYYKGPKGEKVTGYHNRHDFDIPCVTALPEDAFPPFKRGFNSSTLTDPGTPIKTNSGGFSGGSSPTPEPPRDTEDEDLPGYLKYAPKPDPVTLDKMVWVTLPNGELVQFAVDTKGDLWHPKPGGTPGQFHRSGPNDSDTIEKYWELIRQPMTAAMRQDLNLKAKKTVGEETYWMNKATRELYDDYGVQVGVYPAWYVIVWAYAATVVKAVWEAFTARIKAERQERKEDAAIARRVKQQRAVREKEVAHAVKRNLRAYGDPYGPPGAGYGNLRRPTKVSQ